MLFPTLFFIIITFLCIQFYFFVKRIFTLISARILNIDLRKVSYNLLYILQGKLSNVTLFFKDSYFDFITIQNVQYKKASSNNYIISFIGKSNFKLHHIIDKIECHINFDINIHRSENSKTYFVKSLNIKNLNLHFKESTILVSGFYEYNHEIDNQGEIIVDINNMNYELLPEHYREKVEEIFNLISSNNISQDNIKIHYIADDLNTNINGFTIQEIKSKTML